MKTITKLAWSNNRKNRARCVLIILSIFLTTVLLSAIATFGYGQIRFQRVNAEEFYGSYYGTYANVNEQQIAEMQKRSEFDRIGRAASVGGIENTRAISMVWMDEETMRLANMKKQLQEGAFPQQENEIAGQKEMFERLGYPDAKPGDTVTVHFRRNMQETYQEKQFVISGITKSLQEEQENQSYTAYVSRACYEALYAPDERVYNIYFTLADSVPVNSSDLEMTIKDMAEACGINPEYAAENTYFSMWVLDPGMEMITGCVAVALVVVFFAVLVIYNIYQVGLVQKNPGAGRHEKADEKAGFPGRNDADGGWRSGGAGCGDGGVRYFSELLAGAERSIRQRGGRAGKYGFYPPAACLRGGSGTHRMDCSETSDETDFPDIAGGSGPFPGRKEEEPGIPKREKTGGRASAYQRQYGHEPEAHCGHDSFHGTFLRAVCGCRQFYRKCQHRI